MDDNLNEEEREKLRLDNEIRKIKLELEKGARFIEDPDMPSLPPEIENEFLNYIEQFEKMNEHSEKTTIYESIGKPDYKNGEDMTDEEVVEALDQIFELLHEHSIEVDSIHEVDEREMYRFITEDIFKHEVFVMKKLPGMTTQFTYEEFYPDDVKDVVLHIEEFFETFFDLADDEDFFKHKVSDLETTNKWLYEFREAYYKIELHELNVREVQVHDDEQLKAEAVYEIAFDAYTDGVAEKHVFDGSGTVTLAFTPGGWMIQQITFPQAT